MLILYYTEGEEILLGFLGSTQPPQFQVVLR